PDPGPPARSGRRPAAPVDAGPARRHRGLRRAGHPAGPGLAAEAALQPQRRLVQEGAGSGRPRGRHRPSPALPLRGRRPAAGADPSHHRWLAETVRTLLPLMERAGIAHAAEVELETLAQRLIDEAEAGGGAACGMAMALAWTRI